MADYPQHLNRHLHSYPHPHLLFHTYPLPHPAASHPRTLAPLSSIHQGASIAPHPPPALHIAPASACSPYPTLAAGSTSQPLRPYIDKVISRLSKLQRRNAAKHNDLRRQTLRMPRYPTRVADRVIGIHESFIEVVEDLAKLVDVIKWVVHGMRGEVDEVLERERPEREAREAREREERETLERERWEGEARWARRQRQRKAKDKEARESITRAPREERDRKMRDEREARERKHMEHYERQQTIQKKARDIEGKLQKERNASEEQDRLGKEVSEEWKGGKGKEEETMEVNERLAKVAENEARSYPRGMAMTARKTADRTRKVSLFHELAAPVEWARRENEEATTRDVSVIAIVDELMADRVDEEHLVGERMPQLRAEQAQEVRRAMLETQDMRKAEEWLDLIIGNPM